VIPRVIASDLDGTLLRSDGSVDDRTRHALTAVRAAGATVILCTARPARWMASLAQATGDDGVSVCANGAVVWDVGADRLLRTFPLSVEAAREVVQRMRRALPGGAWALERVDRFAHEPAYEPRWPVPEDTVVDHIDRLLDEPIVKLMIRHPRMAPDELLDAGRRLAADVAEVSISSTEDALLEISAHGVSKASSLAWVCAAAGVVAADVLAFGDMPNDLPMLRWAGRSVAVANAHPDVIAAADAVTRSNDDSGVAEFLEALLASADQ
jgi:HAD superfamily hydrolase (TIGR01484 family)